MSIELISHWAFYLSGYVFLANATLLSLALLDAYL